MAEAGSLRFLLAPAPLLAAELLSTAQLAQVQAEGVSAAFALRIVVTHDLDFSAILAATQALGPSVVQIRADNLNPRVLGAHVIRAVSQQAAALQAGALLAVRADSSRVRILPLTSGVAGHTP